MRVLALQPEFGDPGHLGETDRFDMFAAQAKLLAASAEIRAGAGPNIAIQRDDVTAAFAVHRPAAVAQGRHLHLAAPQGSLCPGRAFELELVLQDEGCGDHRVCISLLSCQNKRMGIGFRR